MSANAHRDVLLTGASGAIGTAIARRLARAGLNLHLTSRDPSRLKPLVSELGSSPVSISTYALDLADLLQCEQVVGAFFKQAKDPAGLICNAGNLGVLGPFLEIDFKEWTRSIHENFLSHAAMIHAFAQRFSARHGKGGAIVILSGAGLGGPRITANLSSYGTAKAALTYMAEALAVELKDFDITINAIAPGQVKSGITEQALRAGPARVGAYAESAQKCMDTGGVSPDLAAELTAFLMSPQARGISGRLLSARFDQEKLRAETNRIAGDSDLYRLRRIDEDLFAKRA